MNPTKNIRRIQFITGCFITATLAACGGGGGGSNPAPSNNTSPQDNPNNVSTPIAEPATLEALLTSGIYDIQGERFLINNSPQTFLAKHTINGAVAGIHATTSTKLTSTVSGITIGAAILYNFDQIETLETTGWRAFQSTTGLEFSTPDTALLHFNTSGSQPSKWVFSVGKENVGGTNVVDTVESIFASTAVNPATTFIADTTAYFPRITNNADVVVRQFSVGTAAKVEADLRNRSWCLANSNLGRQLNFILADDGTMSIYETTDLTVCNPPAVTDTVVTGQWVSVTVEGFSAIEMTFPAELNYSAYQSLLEPAEFTSKAKLLFVRAGSTTEPYDLAIGIASGTLIELDDPLFSERAVTELKKTFDLKP